MRKVILSLAVSLDGFIEGPNREIDWLEFTKDGEVALTKFLDEIDTVLYGRVSYEAWGNYQPAENGSDFEKNFYGKLATMRKIVFSSSKTEFPGDPQVVGAADVAGFVENLKRQPGKDIWLYGGAKFLTTMLNLNLVDEFRLAISPVILGDGTAMFQDIQRRVKLKLLNVKSGAAGIIEVNYEKVAD